MEYTTFKVKLEQAFSENGYNNLLNDKKAKKLFEFTCTLVETNKLYNLTAIKDEDGIILKHLVDCASICEYIPESSSMIDVGCGAGFPSIPVAILREDVRIVSLDSTEKRIKFIDKTVKELSIQNISAKVGRAEEYAQKARETFDIATSRAVARLNVLNELCIPFIKVGGAFIAMKSSKGEDELAEAVNGISKLGGRLENKVDKRMSFGNETIEREIYIIKKEKNTPSQYPRNYSQISKKPL